MEFRQGLAIGSIVGGDYRILDVLGQGGFGLTYKGFDNRLGSIVAIKEYFPADMALREDGTSVRVRSTREEGVFAWGREKFLDEAKTLARFRHNNIVRVARLFEENNTAYMVLDFEEGPSLSQWRANLGRPPRQDELDRIATQLLEAVEVVHNGGILHRDIKPQNVIMRGGVEPVLIDFGAARASLGQRSKTVHAIVTPGYSPKEQYALDVDRQGAWSDIYALGATFYFLVTGHSPPDALTRDLEAAMPMETDGSEPYRESFLLAIDEAMQVRAEDRPQTIEAWRPLLFSEAPTVSPQQRGRASHAATVVLAPPQRHPAATGRAGTVRAPTARQTAQSLVEAAPRPRSVSFDELQSPPSALPAPPNRTVPIIAGAGALLAAAAGLWFYTFVIQPQQDDAAWQSAQAANSVQAYEAYLTRRPNGRYAADARARRQQLAAATPAPRSDPAPPVPAPPIVQPAPQPPVAQPAPTPPIAAPSPPATPIVEPQPQPPVPAPDTPSANPPGDTVQSPTSPRRPARPTLAPRVLPGPLPQAELEQIQRSVANARWRLVTLSTQRVIGLSVQHTDFAAELERLSTGRVTVNAIDPQEIGGGNRMLNEVVTQADLIGWHAPIFSQSRSRAYLIFHGAIPFGLAPPDHVRWMRADGTRLLEQLYVKDRFPVRAIPCGIAGASGSWFRREIRSPADFRGLKVRGIGFASDVLQRLGAQGTGSQSTDLAAAFAANTVDAALFSTPLTGIFAKTPLPAPVFHHPSWHAPAYLFDLLIGTHHWQAMSEGQQKLIDEACRRNLDKWVIQFDSSQTEVLTQIRNVRAKIGPFTGPTLEALRKATDEVLAEESAKNADFKDILESYNRFRR
ncbi:MAG: protein kinase domain-containing protein [Hyphomicrobiaceae bacterium]